MRKSKRDNSFPLLHKKYLILVVIILLLSFFAAAYLLFTNLTSQKQRYNAASPNWQNSDKIYTNNVGKFTLEYPSTWMLQESHTISNRVVDNPNEINTAKLMGKEGEILIEWGPMGFGGGCDPEDHVQLSVGNKTEDICHGIDEDGNEYWRGLSNEHTDESIAEIVYAEAYKPLRLNQKIIKEILSSLLFR